MDEQEKNEQLELIEIARKSGVFSSGAGLAFGCEESPNEFEWAETLLLTDDETGFHIMGSDVLFQMMLRQARKAEPGISDDDLEDVAFQLCKDFRSNDNAVSGKFSTDYRRCMDFVIHEFQKLHQFEEASTVMDAWNTPAVKAIVSLSDHGVEVQRKSERGEIAQKEGFQGTAFHIR